MLLALERRITANAMMRAKHADAPAAYMESEVDLDEAVKGLSVLAAAPELFPSLVQLGVFGEVWCDGCVRVCVRAWAVSFTRAAR